MRSTVFAAVGSAVALVGFAGAASASATIDLIWADTGTDTISGVNTSSAITLQVILTAGPNGSAGAGVSVDYSAVLGTLAVLGYASTPSEGNDSPLPIQLGSPSNTGTRIENINSVAIPTGGIGTGLATGQSHQLGTVTFQSFVFLNGTFEIQSDADGPTDAVLDIDGNDITPTTTFNSAFLISCLEPTAACKRNRDCCSNICSGQGRNKTCQPEPTPDICLEPPAACQKNKDCCSNICSGQRGNKTCQP